MALRVSPLFFAIILLQAHLIPVGAQSGDWNEDDDSFDKTEILHGQKTRVNSHPYHILIKVRNHPGIGFCSGALIASNYVLTSAECVKGKQVSGIAAGAEAETETEAEAVVRDARQVVRFEYYARQRNENIVNDIALLEVKPAFPIGKGSVAVPVQRVGQQPSNDCHIIGWARHGNTSYVQRQSVKAPLWPKYISQHLIPALKKDMLCAGNAVEGRNNCVGDAGSMLVCKGQLTGIANIGIPCWKPGFPQSFTDVSYFADWLDRSMRNLDFVFDD